MSDIDSESDWENEGPLQLAANPNERMKHRKNLPPPPQMPWSNEPQSFKPYKVTNYHLNQDAYGNRNSTEAIGPAWERQSHRRLKSRQNSPKRQSKVDRHSYQVKETGSDGEQNIQYK